MTMMMMDDVAAVPGTVGAADQQRGPGADPGVGGGGPAAHPGQAAGRQGDRGGGHGSHPVTTTTETILLLLTMLTATDLRPI